MSYCFAKDGGSTLAKILVDSGKINGMYLEYGGPNSTSAPRDRAYFAALAPQGAHGYVRIRLTAIYADGDTIHATAMLSREQLPADMPETVVFNCVSLAVLNEHEKDDKIICTSDLDKQIGVSSGAYTTIHTSLTIG